MAVSAAVTGAVVATGSAVHSIDTQKSAARESKRQQEKANLISGAAASVENAKNRRRAVAQARIASARNIAAGVEGGFSGSSLSGAQASLASNLGSNVSSQLRDITTGQQVFGARQAASFAEASGARRADASRAIGNLGSQAFATSVSLI